MIVPAPTFTDPVNEPAGTVIEGGKMKVDRLAPVVTTAPPAGAAAEREMVQVMLDPEVSGVDGQVSDVT